MSYPYHDGNWREALEFLERHRRPNDTVIAPDIFIAVLDTFLRYSATEAQPLLEADWVVTATYELPFLNARFLRRLSKRARPVLANGSVVVWTKRRDLPRVASWRRPYLAFLKQRWRRGRAPTRPLAALVSSDPHRLTRFSSLSPRDLGPAMDRFYDAGGYFYETERDRAYRDEISRLVETLAKGPSGQRVLDIGCGQGRVLHFLADPKMVVGLDLSQRAVTQARQQTGAKSVGQYLVAAGEQLPFAEACFDQVLVIDAMEHFYDAWRVVREAARVLRPGGSLVLTAANRDSLNQRLQRKMGLPPFLTNYQHIAEFTLAEVEQHLQAEGLVIETIQGCQLYPFWGLPFVDSQLQNLLDNDVELVSIFRDLGRSCSPALAYTFAVRARKVASS